MSTTCKPTYTIKDLNEMTPYWLCKLFLPNAIVVSTVTQDEDEEAWLRVRADGIGGSDVGTICGVNNFSSIRVCYLQKTGQWDQEKHPFSDVSKENMYWGHRLEPVVADEYGRRNDCYVMELGATVAHKDIPWARANIDRMIFEKVGFDTEGTPQYQFKGVLEVKTANVRTWEEWEEGNIKESYRYQLNWYLFVCGVGYGAFACLVGGQKFFELETWYYPELINEYILPKSEYFWNENVQKLIEPPMDGTGGATEFIKEEYPKGTEADVTFIWDEDPGSLNVDALADAYIAKKVEYKIAEKEVEAIKNQLKDQMKLHVIGYTEDHVIKWPNRSKMLVDGKLLKEKYPEIYNEVIYKCEYRDFRVK